MNPVKIKSIPSAWIVTPIIDDVYEFQARCTIDGEISKFTDINSFNERLLELKQAERPYIKNFADLSPVIDSASFEHPEITDFYVFLNDIVVDGVNGDDNNRGNLFSPFKTIERALALLNSQQSGQLKQGYTQGLLIQNVNEGYEGGSYHLINGKNILIGIVNSVIYGFCFQNSIVNFAGPWEDVNYNKVININSTNSSLNFSYMTLEKFEVYDSNVTMYVCNLIQAPNQHYMVISASKSKIHVYSGSHQYATTQAGQIRLTMSDLAYEDVAFLPNLSQSGTFATLKLKSSLVTTGSFGEMAAPNPVTFTKDLSCEVLEYINGVPGGE